MVFSDNTRIVDLTVGQLRQILIEEIAQALSENHGKESTPMKTVPIEKLSELTGWSKSAIYKKCSLRILPHSKVGKELRFDMNEINELIKNKKRKSGDELVLEFESRHKKIKKK